MPITQLRLKNFKCFEDSGDIPLAPLTLIFGRNNSGKSSILQSLLLLRQTLDAPGHGLRLNLGGPLYEAGIYQDIVHQHRVKEELHMQFVLGSEKHERGAHLDLTFTSDEPHPPRLSSLEVRSGGIRPLAIRRGRGAGGPYELVIGNDHLGGEKRGNFRCPVNQFLPLIGTEPPRVGRPSSARDRSRAHAREVLSELEVVVRNMRAVGAFRKQPARRYEFIGSAPNVVDAAGENVISALIEDSIRRKRKGELFRPVNRWLKLVGGVRILPLRRISRSGRIFEVRIKDIDSGRWANFADVGFGIGQAFPVLVEGLRTPEGGMFVVQEPEIHLHPNAQLAMADFLVDLAGLGRRVIVETHSEALLLRVRHRIVLAMRNGRRARGLAPDHISVVYVDKDGKGRSRTRRLTIDDLGQLDNWPADFMEEVTQERMDLMESMAKRVESAR